MEQACDLDHLRRWIGRRERREEVLTAFPLRALKATLEAPYVGEGEAGEALPPLWHWLYFLPLAAQSSLARDGHPHKGGFLPPVPLPRRMWAGGRFGFTTPLTIGARAVRDSTVTRVEARHGQSGALVFVTVRHDIAADGGACLWEEHDIVYRAAQGDGRRAGAANVVGPGTFHREVSADEVLLFRYSALTFNGHRIHYDRRFATEVEGYPGLVVHGPLIATLLIDLLLRERPTARLAAFEYRALRPVFDGRPLQLCGHCDGASSVRLWARDEHGFEIMAASARLA
ncbi:MAG: MaoC family dehydratase N-terminal domain-containing protein [Rhodocyclaceae bacterium]|nr:MaoC family dehydratase N-terminal domain-containing protein [Rhodocyclaceae bacterium]